MEQAKQETSHPESAKMYGSLYSHMGDVDKMD